MKRTEDIWLSPENRWLGDDLLARLLLFECGVATGVEVFCRSKVGAPDLLATPGVRGVREPSMERKKWLRKDSSVEELEPDILTRFKSSRVRKSLKLSALPFSFEFSSKEAAWKHKTF